MTIAHRLQEAMNGAGITSQSELARRAGVPQPTINRILRGAGRHGPSVETLKKLSTACGVPFQWLGEGTGMLPQEPASADTVLSISSAMENVPAISKSRRLNKTADPVRIRTAELRLSTATTELTVYFKEQPGGEVYVGRDWLQKRGYDDQMLIALPMTGDSMVPALYGGDTLIVNLADRQPSDGDVFVISYEGEGLVKRLMRDVGAWWLCADSSDQRRYQRKQYSSLECSLIGRVVYKLSENV
jgi:phage repressor protein C with HTH and peptisase S24 domain